MSHLGVTQTKVSQAPNLKYNQVEKWNLDMFLLRFIEANLCVWKVGCCNT